MEQLAANGQLMAYKHTPYLHAMDALREKHILEMPWQESNPPQVV